MRLNRLQFGVGYMALCFGGTIFMQLIFFAIASVAGGIEAVFEHPEWTTPFFLLLVPLLWGLIGGRAHDLGWHGWPIIVLYLLPWPAWAVLADSAGFFGGGLAAAVGDRIPVGLLLVSVFGPVIITLIVLIVLAATPGQKRANRYGVQPRAGLWGDLPPDRA